MIASLKAPNTIPADLLFCSVFVDNHDVALPAQPMRADGANGLCCVGSTQFLTCVQNALS